MRSKTLLLLALTLAWTPAQTTAEPLTLISSSRFVETGAHVGPPGVVESDVRGNSDVLVSSSADVYEGSSAEAVAVLNSRVSPELGLFEGSGMVSIGVHSSSWPGSADSTAVYAATFDLTEARSFSFTGEFAGSGQPQNDLAIWRARLYLRTESGFTRIFDFTTNDSRAETIAGVLLPGRYGFNVDLTARTFGATMVSSLGLQDFRLSIGDLDEAGP